MDRPLRGRCQKKRVRRFPPPFLKHRARDCSIHLDTVARAARFTFSMIYRGFPSKLHHDVPPWVDPNSLFHIRIRLDRDKEQTPLTDALLATTLLKSAEFYDSKFRWHIALFLLMPDHVHALLAFPRDRSMSRVIGDWKHFHARKNRIEWQEGFFDHRLPMTSAGSNCKPRSITSGKILS